MLQNVPPVVLFRLHVSLLLFLAFLAGALLGGGAERLDPDRVVTIHSTTSESLPHHRRGDTRHQPIRLVAGQIEGSRSNGKRVHHRVTEEHRMLFYLKKSAL